MGLLDRLLTTAKRTLSRSNTEIDAAAAELLLNEGIALEQRAQIDAALQRYESAVLLVPSLARAHFNRGNILLDRGAYQEALSAYTEAVALKPDSASTHYNIGNAHLQLGNPESAAAAYRKAMALKPDFTDAMIALEAALEIGPESDDDLFRRGLALQDVDQFDGAKLCYQKAIEINPSHVDACNNLGTILVREERLEEAANMFSQALDSDPTSFATILNLALALKGLDRFHEAAETYRKAIKIHPENAEAHSNLGDLLSKLQRHEESLACYQRAAEIDPKSVDYHFSQGLAYQSLSQLREATICYKKAIELRPNFAEALCNLGAIERQQLNMDIAVAYFGQAIALKPDFADAHCNMGNALQAQGKLDLAEQSYLRALDLKPDFATAHCNYGTVCQSRGDMERAEERYRLAISIDSEVYDAYNNLGVVLNLTRRFSESIECFQSALKIKPDFAASYVNLANVLKDMGQIDQSLINLRKAMEIDPTNLQAPRNLLFVHNYLNDQSAEMMLAEAKRFGETVARMARPFTSWNDDLTPERQLRVGFVSGDLCSHPVGYFLVGVLEALAARELTGLKLFAYPTRHCDDETSHRIKTVCEAWQPTMGMSDEAVARTIHGDQIDILFDLSGHTAHSKLSVFAWKPSPVQVSWLGYFATTGVTAIDYFIADPFTLTKSEEANFTEQVWRLPETRLCFTEPDATVDVSPLPAIDNKFVTFGCFNNLTKMNDAVVAVWARILNLLPKSRLFLRSQQIGEVALRNSICERFALHSIELDRLILEDYGPRADYLAAYQRVDICLDPFPYPGGTTTAEALWMGVPVLTLSGERFLSRQGVGLLTNAGLSNWIASDQDEYVAIAIAHANHLDDLAALRAGLRQQVINSPIFDTARFAEYFEAALRGMWHKWLEDDGSVPSTNREGLCEPLRSF